MTWPSGSRLACVHVGSVRSRISLIPADRPVEFADAVGAEFRDAVLEAVLLVFARAERALHEKVRAFRESLSVFGEFAECDYAVPLGAALPLPLIVLPRFLGGHESVVTGVPFCV